MRRERLTSTFACLTAVVAVAAALAWPGAPNVSARATFDGRQKVSADLRPKLAQTGKVNVVVKSEAAWSRTLDDVVKNNGGAVTKSCANFPLRAVSLPAWAVEALAARADVDYVACGALLSDGVLLGDGALMIDGVLLGDGALLSDGALLADVSVQAARAVIQGDGTLSMEKVVEAGLAPAAPGGLQAAAASKTQFNLTWADNSSNETGFRVERSTDGVNFAQVGTAGTGVKSYASTGLLAGKKYFFRVHAYNADGNSAYTAVVAATTPTK